MASVTKRSWKNKDGTRTIRWRVSYYDADGERQREDYETKEKAEARRIEVEGRLQKGIHTPDKKSVTLEEAYRAFIKSRRDLEREESTIRGYQQHFNLHIISHLGSKKLTKLSSPAIAAWRDTLLETRSAILVSRVLATLTMILNYSREKGWLAENPASAISVNIQRRGGKRVQMPDQRDMGKLLECAQVFDDKGFREAWLVTLATTGLRTSEARALKWQNVHLEEAVPRIFVTERADRWCKVGPVKSDAGERDVLLFPETAAVLKRWRHSGPVTPYVFPTASGRIWHYHNFYHRVWVPWCRNAGLVTPLIDAKTGGQGAYKDGRLKWTPTVAQHQLRHAAASFMIAMGVQPKELQTFMGHSSIQITYDRYGHLWRASAFDAAFQARGDAEIRRLFPTLPAPGND